MDTVLKSLVGLVSGIDRASLSESTVDSVVRHTLDTVGCGAGGFASGPARVARETVRGSGGALVASVYGEAERVLVDLAGFANATADRYLDFNDFGVSGHPSDMIPALLAMTEAADGTGADLVTAIAVAYEVATRLAEAVPPDLGWDQGIYCSLGIAAGQAKLLGLSAEKTAHALSLAVVPAIPLRVTRFGELSEWKAAATGHAALTATFAVRLAAAGMTGPPAPFEGKDGLLERVWPEFGWDPAPAECAAIRRASLKRHPACYWGQVPVDLVTEARERVDLAQVAAIEVATCANAWRAIGGGRGDAAEKWRPATRETADHSMPYLMAAAFVDGRLTDAAFTPERLRDPELLSVMDRISVVEREDLTARATRDSCPTELVVRSPSGSVTLSADVPKGHPEHPMTDGEVHAKFAALAAAALPGAQVRELAGLLWDLPRLESLASLARLFRAFSPR
ncbi:MmgE/PrpD family protein [Amycolatopsis orientalis]|uniref:MmgE/PrpD family protein n=1 Tax=Amycolatopsis orientalis TaxID=31958 RepID=UPI00039E8ACC|nr:MmgE/PrpD family protein [Amycolatopsis orientalis]